MNQSRREAIIKKEKHCNRREREVDRERERERCAHTLMKRVDSPGQDKLVYLVGMMMYLLGNQVRPPRHQAGELPL